jgi:putative endonuclease
MYVYILANRKNGALYIGATSDLIARVYQHKEKVVESFTKRYGIDRLVYFEIFADAYNMVTRERYLKNWRRAQKIALIEKDNPDWKDLYPGLLG